MLPLFQLIRNDMMKKMIVFIYPFEKIERIVDYAFRFARDINAELEFVHAVEAGPAEYDPALDKQVPDSMATATTIGAIQEEMMAERQRVLQKTIGIKKASVGLTVPLSWSVTAGTHLLLNDEISERNDVDLILVPTAPDELYDVTAPDVAANNRHPVLVFPVNQDYRPFKTIVYATDFHDEDIVVLKHLIGLTEPLEANITVFHISHHRKTYEEELKKAGMEELINRKIMFREIPVVSEQAGNVTEGIKEFSKRNYADLIVLMREDKNFFQRVFGRSTTKELLRDTDIPVLVYHQ